MPYSVLRPFMSYNRRFAKDDIIEDGADLGGLSVADMEGKFISTIGAKKAAKIEAAAVKIDEPVSDQPAENTPKSRWT